MKSRNMTIGTLARASVLSRSTLLYYDKLGLLRPGQRSAANYRVYSPEHATRLEQICLHRKMGVPLKEIAELLRETGTNASIEILRRRLRTLDQQIAELRRQQRCIVRLLEQEPILLEVNMIKKERWVEIMKAAGFSKEDMQNWHIQFEKMEPTGHQEFLASLGIEPAEIEKIRERSRSQFRLETTTPPKA